MKRLLLAAAICILPVAAWAQVVNNGPAPVYEINIKNAPYSAREDGATLTDVTTTNASAVISSVSHCFTQADASKLITIGGAGAAGAVLNATISSTATCAATLSTTAGTAIAGTAVATYGSDDTAAIQAAVTAASAAGGGTLVMPTGMSIVSGSLTWQSQVSMRGSGAGKSILKYISASDMTSAIFTGLSGSNVAPYTDNQFTDFEVDVEAATQAVYNVAGKAFFFQFMRRPLFANLYVHGSPATCVGVDYLQSGRIVNNSLQNCGRLASGGGGAFGGAGIGVGTSSSAFSDGSVVSGNTIYLPAAAFGRYGIFFETQNATSIKTWNRISDNLIYLQGNFQYGIGASGAFSTLIANNTINGSAGTSQRGISIDLGTVGTVTSADPYGKLIGNIINNVDIGVYYDGTGSAQTVPAPYTFENNSISGNVRYGYYLHSGASLVLDGMTINGGAVYGHGAAGILLDGTSGFKNLTINNVKISGNAQTTVTATLKTGISVGAPVARLTMHGNDIYDGGSGKQLYAMIVNAVAVTLANISANNLAANATGAINLASGGTIAGWIMDNAGYNPIGASSVSPTGSPMTYTAGATPETLYISGGTVSAIVKNSVTLASATGFQVQLDPGEAVVVTYSVAPTMTKDQH